MDELIERGDLDELLRFVDRLADARDWAQLVELAQRCRRAHERGRPLWPAAEHALYRVALDGSPALACHAVAESDGRFSLGPLTEVIASTHEWPSLAAHLEPGPLASTIAHECAIRGEDLSGAPTIQEYVDLPLVMQSWEPEYPVATYTEYALDAGAPPSIGALHPIVLPKGVGADDDRTGADAFSNSCARGRVVVTVAPSCWRCRVEHKRYRRIGARRATAVEIEAPTRWRLWRGARQAVGPEARAEGCRGDVSTHGGPPPRSSYSTGRLTPTNWASRRSRRWWPGTRATGGGWVLRLAIETPKRHGWRRRATTLSDLAHLNCHRRALAAGHRLIDRVPVPIDRYAGECSGRAVNRDSARYKLGPRRAVPRAYLGGVEGRPGTCHVCGLLSRPCRRKCTTWRRARKVCPPYSGHTSWQHGSSGRKAPAGAFGDECIPARV